MQGGPLSPLLANILLDDFDKELESRGLRFVRYADDFLVFTKTSEAAQRVFASLERYLTRKLKLVVNRDKSRVCSTNGVEFLGFTFQGYGGQFRVSRKNLDKFQSRVREITGRNRVASLRKLGIPADAAYHHGMSSKGPWVLSFSPGVHKALSTALLEERGLPSLLAIWTKLTAKNRTA